MDTTASMANYIEAAQQRCLKLLEAILNQTESNQPKNYVLVPFNDPDFGPAIRTTDSEIFKQEVSRLQAGRTGDGGDLPEMSLSAVILASDQSEPRSPLFIFTDDAAKDRDRIQEVTAAVTQKQQPVYFIGKLPESLQDPLYSRLAAVSGGRVLTTNSSLEDIFLTSGVIGELTMGAGSNTLLTSMRDMQETTKSVTLLVDDQTEMIDLLVGHETRSPTVRVTPPLQGPLEQGRRRRSVPRQPQCELIIDTPTTKLCRLTKPITGVWTIDIDASRVGWYAEIRGKSGLDIFCSLERPANEYNRFSAGLESSPVIGTILVVSVRCHCRQIPNSPFPQLSVPVTQ